jgi:DNA-binding CsgD family transcriptional regulator
MAKKPERLNTSQIAMRVFLNRATVKNRLLEAGIQPVERKARENIFEFTEELEELLTSENKPIDVAKLKKTEAEAEIKHLEAQKRKGEMASVAEFTEVVQSLFGAMHKKIAVQFPKNIAARLAKAASAKEISEILSHELGKIFNDLREDHRKFLK